MLLGQGLLRGCGTPAQQADIMCLMLPNTDELLLEQSIFKYLSACYPQPCSNYSNSVLGSPSSKPMQLRLGLGGLGGLMAPGLCPGMHCGSPRSHPTFPAPAAPSWAAGYHLQALARGLCKHLSDSSGSVPTVPAVRPSTLGIGNPPGGAILPTHWGFHRAVPRTRGSGIVLQSRFPPAHVAFGKNSNSPGTLAEPVYVNP